MRLAEAVPRSELAGPSLLFWALNLDPAISVAFSKILTRGVLCLTPKSFDAQIRQNVDDPAEQPLAARVAPPPPAFYITPQRRLSSHSPPRIPSSNKKKNGMSQRSMISRDVMPASENRTSRGKSAISSRVQ